MLPFGAVGPVCGGHFSFGDVGGVAGFEGFSPVAVGGGFACFLGGACDSLLAEADEFGFAVFFGEDGVGFGGVSGGAFWFVVAGEFFASVFDGHGFIVVDMFVLLRVWGINLFCLLE